MAQITINGRNVQITRTNRKGESVTRNETIADSLDSWADRRDSSARTAYLALGTVESADRTGARLGRKAFRDGVRAFDPACLTVASEAPKGE